MTAAEVAAMEIGRNVLLCGEDENGQQREIVCTVSGHPGRTFLTYRVKGELHRCKIKDYPGKYFRKLCIEGND